MDRFKADDVAFGYITAKRQVRVGFVSDDVDSKMLTLLDLMPRVVLTSLTNADYQGLESEELQFDILVFDRVSVDRKPVIPSIFFGVNSANWLGASVSSIRSSQLSVERNTAHPILRNISMTDLLIESGVLFAPMVGVEALLTSEDEAILAIAVPGAVKSVLLGFDLDKSNLAFLADFPIFLSNSITWLVDEPPILNATPGTIKLPSDITKVYRIDGVDVPYGLQMEILTFIPVRRVCLPHFPQMVRLEFLLANLTEGLVTLIGPIYRFLNPQKTLLPPV